MVDLYLLKNFSNYFNRKVKYRATLSEYIDDLTEGEDYFILKNTNFNPNDGVSTAHIVGSANRPYTPEWQPDYCLVVEWPDCGQPRIISRWFVTEFVRTMINQYSVALKRDTPCDKYELLKQAPCYIQKATLPNDSPLIVNSEGMNLNQKKVAEYLLKDKSKVPWIVVYIETKNAHENIPVNVGGPTNYFDLERDTSSEGQLMRKLFLSGGVFTNEYQNDILKDLNVYFNIQMHYAMEPLVGNRYCRTLLGQTNAYVWNGVYGNLTTALTYTNPSQYDSWPKLKQSCNNLSQALALDYRNFFNYFKDKIGVSASERLSGDIGRLTNGRIWKYGQNYYELVEDNYGIETKDLYITTATNDYLVQKMNDSFDADSKSLVGNNKFVFYNAQIRHVHYRLVLRNDLQASLNIKASRKHAQEVPYDIIAFPYDTIRVNQWDQNINEVASLAAGRSIAIELAGGCYDVQILPFCPVLDQYIDSEGNIDLGNAVEDIDYCVVKQGNTKYTIGFYAHSAYQSLTVNKLYGNNEEYDVGDICNISDDGIKIDNECDMWRLCAPNWTAQFEFKLTKTLPLFTHARMERFDVDITYRPYQPYIRVAPQFDFLYVTDYKDARGLLCGSGFSITLVDDKWATYELNNKNYQNIFNREIQNMEVTRNIAREEEAWNITETSVKAGVGIFNSVGKMGMSTLNGAMKGGWAGAAMSAGAGAFGVIGSAVGGGMDIANSIKQAGWAERAYQENRDYKIDMFKMSLDNIKALPASITQNSAISYNFKFFPVLEKYTCTDEERQMVKNKIKWNGMTVGLIGTIGEYLNDTEERYIQGELIRLDDLNEDSHFANDLYNEVKKGLFFEPYIQPNKENK